MIAFRCFGALAAVLLAGGGTVHAQATAEQTCQFGRAIAAAKYAQCAHKALARFSLTGADEVHKVTAGKCVAKYAGTWARLQAVASGSGATCDNPRFVDNGDGTVTDRLTGLQWEKKTADATVHAQGNVYPWTGGGAGFTAADGPLFTSFLAALNGAGCFAGQCDWRIPTRDELLTIASPAYPGCATGGPCIDPIFGPTTANLHWSATTFATFPVFAWSIDFFNGKVNPDGKSNEYSVRAVRGGL